MAQSSAEAEIYAGAMAAQELCWLTFLLTDLGERPRSAPTLFANNKAMIILCREPLTGEQSEAHRHQAPKAPAELVADAGEEVRTQCRRPMLCVPLWLGANPPPPPPPAVLGCLALPLTFFALSDLITVANECGRSGAGGSGAGGHQELELSDLSPLAALGDTPGFPPRTSSPPLHPVAADFGGPGVLEGGDAGGAGSGCAAFGGARSPLVGGVGGTSAGGAGAGGAGSGGALQSLPRRPIFLEQLSSSLLESTPTCTIPLLFPPPDSPLPAPARYVPLSVSLTRRWEPVSCAASSAPSRVTREPVVLPLPRPSSLPAVPDPVSDLARATRLTILCCLAALVTAPASSPAAACALVAELAVFAATCRHAYLVGLVSASSCPPSVGGELALDYDVFEDMQFKLEYLPYPLSIWTRYVAPGRHHPVHWRVARRVLRYLVRLASIK
ncbi:unnamed protein product [Closterium sp. NIES-54]